MALSATSAKAGKAASAASASASRRRGGIFMILSPAKTLDLSQIPLDGIPNVSQPSCDVPKTEELANILKNKSQKQLKDLLKVSDKIASSVKSYYESFDTSIGTNVQVADSIKSTDNDKDNTNANANDNARVKPAVFSFNGPAFKGIDPSSCEPTTLKYMQEHLRIVDPLYGALKPLDEIQPYRLEMASKGIMKDLQKVKDQKEKGKGKDDDDADADAFKYKSLANWWKESITSNILHDMQESKCAPAQPILVNLASDEYASAIDAERLRENNCRFVKIAFQQDGKVIAVHAKRARGLMVRYISENQIVNGDGDSDLGLDGVKQFDLDGYEFCDEKSDDDLIVFDRCKGWKDKEESGGGSGKGKKRKVKKGSGKDGASKKSR